MQKDREQSTVQGAGAAPLPADEAQRLAALHGYGILDTLPELMFDDIAQLAASICDTPIALVSLVDSGRQWFKARVGLDAHETHRDLAFCAHAILRPDEVMVVADATQDRRFAQNTLVTGDPKIRFYAGAPIIAPAGEALGTVCAIDRRERALTSAQTEALRALARQASRLLEYRKMTEARHADLTNELRQVIEQLDARNTSLQRFVYMMSHDVREPVNTICNFAGLLETHHAAALGSQGQRYLQFVSAGGARIRTLLDDLLSFVALDDKVVAAREVDLGGVVDGVIAELARPIEQANAKVTRGELPRVCADERLMRVLFQNLIGNAVKFRAPGVAPVVEITGHVDGETCLFAVRDNGIGIAPEHLGLLFGAFKRLRSRRQYDGTGLGLAICKRIVEVHGGRIEVTSELDKGSQVTVRLPGVKP
jgi:signal transduction histidine kinase